jgi:hypothetical protein
MPDWEPIDPKLHAWVAEGINPGEMCRRLGWDKKKRQTIVDRLRKLGLKAPEQPKATEEPRMPDEPVEVLDGQLSIEDADTELPAVVSAAADIPSVSEVSLLTHGSVDEVLLPAYTEAEAVAWKTRLHEGLQHVRQVLWDGYQRQVWTVLGYANYTECLRAIGEGSGLSETHLWRLHEANLIESNLRTAQLTHGSVGAIPERQLRPLRGLSPETQRAVWAKAQDIAINDTITAAKVETARALVGPRRPSPRTTDPKSPPMAKPKPTEPKVSTVPAVDIESDLNKARDLVRGCLAYAHTGGEIRQVSRQLILWARMLEDRAKGLHVQPYQHGTKLPPLIADHHLTTEDRGWGCCTPGCEWEGDAPQDSPEGPRCPACGQLSVDMDMTMEEMDRLEEEATSHTSEG